MKLIFCLIIVSISNSNCLKNVTGIADYLPDILKSKHIKFALFYTCFEQRENIAISKVLSQHNVRLSFNKLILNNEIFSRLDGFGFIFDLSCKEYGKILKMAGEYDLFQYRYKWLIIDTHLQILKDNLTIFKTFAEIKLRMDSDVTIAFPENDAITFYDIYKPDFKRSEILKIVKLGFWKPQQFKNVLLTSNISKYEQRKDMTGIVFKTAIVNTYMKSNSASIDDYYKDVMKKNYDTMHKESYALFMHIREIHNFNLEVTLANKWFGSVTGGMDGGIAKLLYEEAIDFSITPGLLKSDRIPFYDFVSPTYSFRSCFIFRNPGISGKIQNEFLKPFVTLVWFYILGYMLLFCIILKCAFLAEELLFNQFENNSWTDAYLLTWAVFCQQGATFIPKHTSGRCTLLSLLFMSLLLYNYYTSSIVSSLLSGLPPPFTTIEELTNSNLDVGIEDVVYMRTLFEVTNDTRIQRLYKYKVLQHDNNPSYIKLEDGIAKVKTGGYAYHTEPTNGYQIIEKSFEPYQICDLAEINIFQPTVLWVYAQKHSQYKEMLAIGYLKMLESGIIFRQQKIWVTKKPDCLANTHLVEVGIQQLSPIFIFLLLGLLISVFLLVLERKRKKQTLAFRNLEQHKLWEK